MQTGLEVEVHFYQKSKGRRGKGKNTHTGSKIGFPWFSKGETIETNLSRDCLRLNSDNFRRGCRLQDGSAVQGRSESRWRVVAHRRGGREAQLARGGIRELDAFLGHEMSGPAGTGRGGVSMAGGRKGQGARKGNGLRGNRLPSPPCLFRICLCISAFCLDETRRLLANIHSV